MLHEHSVSSAPGVRKSSVSYLLPALQFGGHTGEHQEHLFGMDYPQRVLLVQPSVIQLKPDALMIS